MDIGFVPSPPISVLTGPFRGVELPQLTLDPPAMPESSRPLNERRFSISSISSTDSLSSDMDPSSFANRHIQSDTSSPEDIGVVEIQMLLLNRLGEYVDARNFVRMVFTDRSTRIVDQIRTITGYGVEECFLYKVDAVAYAIMTVYRSDGMIPGSSVFPAYYLNYPTLVQIASDFRSIRRDIKIAKHTENARPIIIAGRIPIQHLNVSSSIDEDDESGDKASIPLSASVDVNDVASRIEVRTPDTGSWIERMKPATPSPPITSIPPVAPTSFLSSFSLTTQTHTESNSRNGMTASGSGRPLPSTSDFQF